MNWIQQKYDRFILLVAAVILVISSIIIMLKVGSFPETFQQGAAPDRTEIAEPDFAALENAEQRLAAPARWQPREREEATLLVSRPLLQFDDQLINPWEPETPKVHPPVENQWFMIHNLPIEEADVLERDADDDGFENLLEHQYGTNPVDPQAHPPYPIKLVLADVIPNPELVRYSSRPSDGYFAIDRPRTAEPTRFLQLGDPIPNTQWKLVEHEEKVLERENLADKDVSELTVESMDTGERKVLVVQEVTDVGDVTGKFLYLWKGQQEILKKIDETFTLPPDEDVQYKVVDIESDGAVIKRITDNETFNINKS
jgi:hypothetical protein